MYYWANQAIATRKEEVHVNENSHVRSKEEVHINVIAKVHKKPFWPRMELMRGL